MAQNVNINPRPKGAKRVEQTITPEQHAKLVMYHDAAEAAHKAHDHQRFSDLHHAWWQTCRDVIKQDKLPDDSVCEYDTGTVSVFR
jgi:hypothetical protein